MPDCCIFFDTIESRFVWNVDTLLPDYTAPSVLSHWFLLMGQWLSRRLVHEMRGNSRNVEELPVGCLRPCAFAWFLCLIPLLNLRLFIYLLSTSFLLLSTLITAFQSLLVHWSSFPGPGSCDSAMSSSLGRSYMWHATWLSRLSTCYCMRLRCHMT